MASHDLPRSASFRFDGSYSGLLLFDFFRAALYAFGDGIHFGADFTGSQTASSLLAAAPSALSFTVAAASKRQQQDHSE
jgi:hypothetical protein